MKITFMKLRESALKISIIVSLSHCIVGNLIGAKSNNAFVEVIFLPYSFIAGLSNYAGWDFVSIALEVIGLIFMTCIFYPVGLILKKEKSTEK